MAIWRTLFVLLFFGLTLLPGLQMLTDIGPSMTVDENRTLTPPPSKATPLDQIPRVADQWFSDHFGFRSVLIRLATQIDFSVFGMSDRILIGKDGQLFYRSTVNIEEPGMVDYLAKNETAAVQGVRELAETLERKGIHLALIVNLMSDRFYPELLPSSAVRRPAHPRIDDFIAKLSEIPNATFIDSTKILKETMRHRRIFHKTDFHWNDPAAFEVAKRLVDRISMAEGRPASVWTLHLVIEKRRTSGGIAMFMPLFAPPSEMALFVKPSWAWPPGFRSAGHGIFENVTTANEDPKLLPPTVFVGDSYLDGMMRSGLQAYFVETHRIRWKPDLTVGKIIANLPDDTRWLVVQFIEVSQTAVKAFADQNDVASAISLLQSRHTVGAER